MIYVGIDDTDVVGSPGTNQLARAIVRRLDRVARDAIVCRHQLFLDPRVPYTSGNGSASIQLPHGEAVPRAELIDIVRDEMRSFFVDGSDPGLAVSTHASEEMAAFAARARTDIVSQAEAGSVATRAGCHLEGLGGSNQGIIGALAAVALVAGGNDGRVVHMDGWPWPDPFIGVQPVSAIRDRGVFDVCTMSGERFIGDAVDVGKHLRPNWREGHVVLFVEPALDGAAAWRAAKIK